MMRMMTRMVPRPMYMLPLSGGKWGTPGFRSGNGCRCSRPARAEPERFAPRRGGDGPGEREEVVWA